MDARDNIILDEKSYKILYCEYDNIFGASTFGISPTWSNDKNFEYYGTYIINEYQLYLHSFYITSDRGYPIINNVKPTPLPNDHGLETAFYENILEPMKFTGAIIIGNNIVNDYGLHNDIPCYSYQDVRELIFHDGKLVTSIDHSKAMLRIRKNLDLGLRRLDKKRDLRCIHHFVKSSFVGDYQYKKRNNKTNIKSNKIDLSVKAFVEKIRNCKKAKDNL